jgi:hypothetical protein
MKIAALKSFLILVTFAVVASAQDKAPQFTVEGVDGKQTAFSLEQIKQLPRQTLTVADPKTKTPRSYEGVLLSALLEQAGVPSGKKLHGPELRDYAEVSGSDGYKVVFSLFELDPASSDNRVIVAYSMDGKPLEGNNGPLKLIAPEDNRPERWVRMLTGVRIRQAQ